MRFDPLMSTVDLPSQVNIKILAFSGKSLFVNNFVAIQDIHRAILSEGGTKIPESGITPFNGGILTVEGVMTPS